ncbi:MAG: tyrosine-protein phosphatase [Acidaminococcaceae bacterium]
MIDIHTHIINGIDDGAQNMEDSLALLKMAAESGTTDIIATPHVIEGKNHAEWQTILTKTEDLNRNVQEAGIPIRVYAGAELEMNWDMLPLLKTGQSDYCLAGSRYVLVELPANTVPNYADEFLYEVQIKELIPIIAHPERHPYLAKHPRLLHQWLRNGALVQCNIGSFTCKFGVDVKNFANLLLANNMVHFLGTDAHSIEHRHTDTTAGLEVLASKVAPEVLNQIIITNPAAIIADKYIDIEVPKEIKLPDEKNKGFFSSFFD